MDKMREEFEQYCLDNELGMTSSDCTGEYYNPVIEMLWHCWFSSRKKVCVELPSKMSGEVLSLYGIGFNDGIDIAIECIEEAGVSYK